MSWTSMNAIAASAAAKPTGQTMEVDIACVGFGPAMGGFLTTLTRRVERESGRSGV